MPTYDYACDKCDNTFEEQLPISERKDPEGRCMECNDGDVRQVIGVPLFAYDNVRTKFSKKVPSWHTDQMKDAKRNIPGNTL